MLTKKLLLFTIISTTITQAVAMQQALQATSYGPVMPEDFEETSSGTSSLKEELLALEQEVIEYDKLFINLRVQRVIDALNEDPLNEPHVAAEILREAEKITKEAQIKEPKAAAILEKSRKLQALKYEAQGVEIPQINPTKKRRLF
jgi:hypothetical protein